MRASQLIADLQEQITEVGDLLVEDEDGHEIEHVDWAEDEDGKRIVVETAS